MTLLTRNTQQLIAGGKKIFTSDKPVKLILIPALAIVIPNETGLITNNIYNNEELLIQYICFIVLAWIIWNSNVRLMIFLKDNVKLPNTQYYKSISLLLSTIIICTGVISSVALLLWHSLSKEDDNYNPVVNSIVFIVISAVFITNIYENFFLNKEHADTLSRVEQLDLAKTHAELVALKNQIDPHFIFNSLNTLSYLISSNTNNARLYTETLAKVYHYILANREKNLVVLHEEIEFVSNYFYLLKIRFDKAINLVIEFNDTAAEDLLILPISLQILLENVMKHNELSQEQPLTFHISISTGYAVVRNKINRKKYPVSTPRVGLNNLDNRYKLLTGKNILVQNNGEIFLVRLPLINFNK